MAKISFIRIHKIYKEEKVCNPSYIIKAKFEYVDSIIRKGI